MAKSNTSFYFKNKIEHKEVSIMGQIVAVAVMAVIAIGAGVWVWYISRSDD